MRHFFIACFLALLGIGMAYAADPTPDSCTPVPLKVEDKDIILAGSTEKTKVSQVFFFTNKSKQSVFIDHPTGRGASAGWATYLRPDNWAALALNKKNFVIHCSMIEPGKVVALDCSKTITVCQPKNLVSKTVLKGNFWLAEDKNWESFLKALEKRGVSF